MSHLCSPVEEQSLELVASAQLRSLKLAPQPVSCLMTHSLALGGSHVACKFPRAVGRQPVLPQCLGLACEVI